MQLRAYQKDCLEGIISSYKAGKKKILAVLPTGAGKTIIETKLTDMLAADLGPFDSIVHLCHLSDITVKNMIYYQKQGALGDKAFVMQGPAMPTYGTKIIFTTMQTMCRPKRIQKLKDMAFSRKPVVFIIDEAHLYGCSSYDRILDAYPDAVLIGFTATPFRSNHPALNLFDNIAYTTDMESLIEGGWLTKPSMFEFTPPDKTDASRMTAAHKIWMEQERDRGLPGLIVCPTIEQARTFKAVLITDKVRCGYFDGKTPQKQIDQTLADTAAGKIDVLVVCKKGQLGMDIPNLGFVMLPWGVKSVVTFLQVVGRVVRIHPGKERANIYLWGDSPAIKRGHYRRMLKYALEVKDDPEGPAASLKEELEYLLLNEQVNHERVQWTKDAIDSCEALASGSAGFPGIADLISSKRFPKKYANVLKRITQHILKGDGKHADPDRPTDLQEKILAEYKFDSVEGLNKGEASALIAGMKKYMTRSPWTVPRGPYAGRHFSETPPLYRAKLRDPVIRNLFQRWVQAGRPGNSDG